MKRFLTAVLVAMIGLTLSACSDSDGGGSSGGSGSLDCLGIAGKYNTQITMKQTWRTEPLSLNITPSCSFTSNSPSTGFSSGQLNRVTANTYTGTGTNATCPSGKFNVAMASDGRNFAFETDCI